MEFQLHQRLEQDCIELGRFELCRLLLMNDKQYPWFILVPERAGISEVYQLEQNDRLLLMEESSCLAKNLANFYHADKMNIATLGNLVPQLHIHHIARYTTDKSWPAPVWGLSEAIPYEDWEIAETVASLKPILNHCQFIARDL